MCFVNFLFLLLYEPECDQRLSTISQQPGLGCAAESGVRSERSETDARLLAGNLRTNVPDHSAGSLHEEVAAFHDATAQDDSVWSEQRDKICEPKAQIESLAFHAPKRKWNAASRAIANVGGSGNSRARILFEHP
jgi:hypothetical protein